MSCSPLRLPCALALSVLTASFATSATAATYSATLGVAKVTFQGGGKLNLVSSPFKPAAVLRATATTAVGNDLTLGSTDLSSLSLAGSHYVEVASGPDIGMVSNISAQSGSVITTIDDISAAADGELIAIRKIPTIDDVFGADNRFGFQASASGSGFDADRLIIFDADVQASVDYFYFDGDETTDAGWYRRSNGLPAGDVAVYPEVGLIALVIGSNVEITYLGEVAEGKSEVTVLPGLNLVGVFNPLSEVVGVDPSRVLTLDSANFYTGNVATGVSPSSSGSGFDADRLIIWNPVSNSSTQYFYNTSSFAPAGWYDLQGNVSDDVVIETGSSVIVLRLPFNGAFSWAQPDLH